VQYQIEGMPTHIYYCHCSQCRRASGSSFATNMLVSEQQFRFVAGESLLRCFQFPAGKYRYSCSVCGSPIFNRSTATSSVLAVRCGTLDAAPGIKPQAHIWVGSKAPWFEISDGLPQYEGEPPDF
jgi:hypothetical protein